MYAAMFFIAAGDTFVILHEQYSEHISALRSEVAAQTRTIEYLHRYREQNENYANLIQQITETLVTNDAQYGLGGVTEDSIIYDNGKVLEAILSDLHNSSPEEWINHVGQFYSNREDVLDDLPSIWPVVESEFDRITSGHGLRYSPIDRRTHIHEGVDITTSPHNGAVLATAPGVVYGVWQQHPRFGRIVYIRHANGFTTRYAHLSRITVRYQQRVDRGQVIGYIGNSGVSDGAHLHYEIRKNGASIDPVKFMLIK
jgi:murein DD-endopeptidase MepM/ murein hydrolase activator NlpD